MNKWAGSGWGKRDLEETFLDVSCFPNSRGRGLAPQVGAKGAATHFPGRRTRLPLAAHRWRSFPALQRRAAKEAVQAGGPGFSPLAAGPLRGAAGPIGWRSPGAVLWGSAAGGRLFFLVKAFDFKWESERRGGGDCGPPLYPRVLLLSPQISRAAPSLGSGERACPVRVGP